MPKRSIDWTNLGKPHISVTELRQISAFNHNRLCGEGYLVLAPTLSDMLPAHTELPRNFTIGINCLNISFS